ncbi:MAG: CaiB/BaiF CoA transferase family protein [Dehalococcoidia bacterium]
MAQLPLSGVRILDITVVWVGPYCTMLLADWGAEVIRVETRQVFQPSTRGYVPYPSKELMQSQRTWSLALPNWEPGRRPWNRTPLFNSHGRNKLSFTVDLRRPEGQEVLHRLVAISDVLIENNAPDTMEKLGVTYENLRRFNPSLIMVRMPAYGLSGPYATYRAFGSQLESVVGHTSLRGYPDTDPSLKGDVFTADAVGGIMAAFATLAALRHRRRTGQGQQIEYPQAEAFLPMLTPAFLDYILNGRMQGSWGNRHPFIVRGCYPCLGKDRWIVVSIYTDAQFRSLCQVMGRPGLADDPRWADSLSRWKHQDDLDKEIVQWTRVQDAYQVFRRLQEAGVPAGVVTNETDVFSDPHLGVRRYFEPLTQEDTGTHFYPGLLWKAARTPNRLRTPPVRLGEHNPWVYRDLLGYGEEEYKAFESAGHIGEDYPPDLR